MGVVNTTDEVYTCTGTAEDVRLPVVCSRRGFRCRGCRVAVTATRNGVNRIPARCRYAGVRGGGGGNEGPRRGVGMRVCELKRVSW